MSKQKHSFIQFYMDDWRGGTGDMPRLMWSVYFQVCLFNWDKLAPVPPGKLRVLLSDLPGDQGENIIEALIEDGSLTRDERGVFSKRALFEGEKSQRAWEAKSRGGRHGRAKLEESSDTPQTQPQDSSTDQDQDQEQEQDQEQDLDGKGEAVGKKPKAADRQMVVETWNVVARANGLSQVARMTDERSKRLNVRLEEHGVDALNEAIRTIPQCAFLMGENERKWKAGFDWLLRPDACAKLIEGWYHNEGKGKGNAWLNS